METETTWHAATMKQLINTLSVDSAVRGLLQCGSHTYTPAPVDAWSDIDLLLVVADEAMAHFHPETAWLASFGDIYAIAGNVQPDYRTFRTYYTDGRRLDWVIADESSFARIDSWAMNPLAYGYAILYAAGEQIRLLSERNFATAPLSLPTEADFRHLVNDFRFKRDQGSRFRQD